MNKYAQIVLIILLCLQSATYCMLTGKKSGKKYEIAYGYPEYRVSYKTKRQTKKEDPRIFDRGPLYGEFYEEGEQEVKPVQVIDLADHTPYYESIYGFAQERPQKKCLSKECVYTVGCTAITCVASIVCSVGLVLAIVLISK